MRTQLIIGVIISLALLVFVFWKIDTQALWQSLRSANYWYLLPSIGVTFFCMWLRAVRWQWLFIPIKRIRIQPLFSATMIGFMANNLLPARLGEFVRAYVIGKNENVPKSASFGTIVIERVFDGLILLCFLVASILTNSTLPNWVIVSGYAFAGVYVVLLTFLVILALRPDPTTAFLDSVLRKFSPSLAERVRTITGSFVMGLQILRNRTNLLVVVGLSFLLWFVFAFSIYYGLLAFQIELPFAASLLVMAILAFGVTVPSSPGFVGTFHAACVGALAIFSISESRALGFAIVYHASQFLPVTIVGLVYLWMDHLSLRDIQRADAVS